MKNPSKSPKVTTIESVLHAAKTHLKLSYPDEYPATHNKLHIADVTLEGLDEYEAFVKAQFEQLLIEARIEEHDLVFNKYVELSETAFTAWCYSREADLNNKAKEK